MSDFYTGNQTATKHMAQYRRVTSSQVHVHLKDTQGFRCLPFWLRRWMFERGVKASTVHCEQPSLNRGGCLWHQLSPTMQSGDPFSGVSTPICTSPQVASMSDVSPISPSEGNDPPLFSHLGWCDNGMINSGLMILRSTYKGDSPTEGLLPETALNRKSLLDEIWNLNKSSCLLYKIAKVLS